MQNPRDETWSALTFGLGAEPLINRSNVCLSGFVRDRSIVRHDEGEIVVVAFESGRRGAVKQLRRNGHVSLGRESLRHAANVRIHPEGLLENDHAGVAAWCRGPCHVCGHGWAPGNGEFDCFFDNLPGLGFTWRHKHRNCRAFSLAQKSKR